MKQGRINKEHFRNWDVDELQDYLLFLKHEAPQTDGNKYILGLVDEVWNEMLDEIEEKENEEYAARMAAEEPNLCESCGKECEGFLCSQRCIYAWTKY